jgi:hypothetical protein
MGLKDARGAAKAEREFYRQEELRRRKAKAAAACQTAANDSERATHQEIGRIGKNG